MSIVVYFLSIKVYKTQVICCKQLTQWWIVLDFIRTKSNSITKDTKLYIKKERNNAQANFFLAQAVW